MTDEIRSETPEQERQSAEAAFTSSEAPADVVTTTEDAPVVEAAPPAPDPWEGVPAVVRQTLEGINGKMGAVDSLGNDVRRAIGRVAVIQREMDAAKAAAKAVADAPTPAQIAVAAASPEAWNRAKEDFPDWAAGVEERLAAERAEVLKTIPKVDVDGITEAIKQAEERATARADENAQAAERRARQFARVDVKYPDWEDDIRAPDGRFTPEFAAWRAAQPLEIQALASSDHARDAIKMLDGFYEHRKAEVARAKNRERLEAAIPAKGTQAQRQPTQNDRDAAEKAFASA